MNTIDCTTAIPGASEADTIHALQKTVSASRLSLFLQCRLKFWFRHVHKIQKPKTAALHLGNSVHAVLRIWNKARWRNQPLTLKQLHDEFAKAWEDESEAPVQWDDDQSRQQQQQLGWKLVETYVRETSLQNMPCPEAVEVPVEADLENHGLPKLIGILDLVQRGVIVDYKTSAQTPAPEMVVHLHEVQMCGYALLYRASTGKRENGIEIHSLIKLKTPRLVVSATPPMTEAQQTRLFRIMESYVDGLDRRDWVPSPGMQCHSCDYYHECRAWNGK